MLRRGDWVKLEVVAISEEKKRRAVIGGAALAAIRIAKQIMGATELKRWFPFCDTTVSVV